MSSLPIRMPVEISLNRLVQLTPIFSQQYNKKERRIKAKIFLLLLKSLWIYSFHFPVCHTAVLAISSVQSLSRVRLCDPMNCSMPGLPVHHQLPEFTQTHAHRVGDAIQPSHPLSSSSPPAPNPSQRQGLFQ